MSIPRNKNKQLFLDACKKGNIILVEEFLHKNKPQKQHKKALYKAVFYGNLNIVKLLETAGYDISGIYYGTSLLAVAARNGHVNIVKYFISQNKFNINPKNNNPLINACAKGQIDIVNLLLDHDADPNISDNAGNTPLTYAIRTDYHNIIDILLVHGADYNFKNLVGETPVFFACFHNDLISLQKVFPIGADINIQNYNGETLLMTAIKGGARNVVRWLISEGRGYQQ